MGNSKTVKKYPFLIAGNLSANIASEYLGMLREGSVDVVIKEEGGMHFIYGHSRPDSLAGRAMIIGYKYASNRAKGVLRRFFEGG